MDLRHVGPLIGGIPTDTMGRAGRVLRERGEWIVLSAFVGDVPAAKLEVLLDLFDGEALLRAGFVIEDLARLDSVVALLPDHRLDELFVTAQEQALWREAISLATHIGPEQAQRIVAVIDRLPDASVDALLVAADEHDLWEQAITVACLVLDDPDGGSAIISGFARLEPAQQERVGDVLNADGALRSRAGKLIAAAPPHLRTRLSIPRQQRCSGPVTSPAREAIGLRVSVCDARFLDRDVVSPDAASERPRSWRPSSTDRSTGHPGQGRELPVRACWASWLLGSPDGSPARTRSYRAPSVRRHVEGVCPPLWTGRNARNAPTPAIASQ